MKNAQNKKSSNNANRYSICNRIGSVCIILGLSLFTFGFYSIFQNSSEASYNGQRVQDIGATIREVQERYRGSTGEEERNICEDDRTSVEKTESDGDGYEDGTGGNDGVRIQPIQITITSYNAEVGQTDNSPCIGAIGVDVCEKAKQGVRVIALSQDLIAGTKGHYCKGEDCFAYYGDHVKIESENSQCNGEYVVLDTMHEKWKLRADIFFLNKEFNTSCIGTLYNLNK